MSPLSIVQIVVAVLLVAAILLQQRGGGGLGGAFGGEGGGSYATRRGLQQKLHWATVTLGILFVSLALLNLLI